MPTPNKIETHGDNKPQFHHSPVSGNVRTQYILKLTQKNSIWLIIYPSSSLVLYTTV